VAVAVSKELPGGSDILYKTLEKTLDLGHNLTKTESDITTAALTPDKGWFD
jgi:hypothetical protein